MIMRTTFAAPVFARIAVAAAAGLAAITAAGAAAAQPYDRYDGGGYYDPCVRDQNQRATAGVFIGGASGAVIGSQLAARGHRTDGSLLGGLLGAVAGGVVGNRTAACEPGGRAYYPSRPAPTYNEGLYTGGRGYYRQDYRPDYRDDYDYGPPRRETYRVIERPIVVERPPADDGCTVAESPVYMPDGRTDKRMVRVCPDSSGRYRVVD